MWFPFHALASSIIVLGVAISVHARSTHSIQKPERSGKGMVKLVDWYINDGSRTSLISHPLSKKSRIYARTESSNAKARIRKLVLELNQLEHELETYATGSSSFLIAIGSLLQTIEESIVELRRQAVGPAPEHEQSTSVSVRVLRPPITLPEIIPHPIPTGPPTVSGGRGHRMNPGRATVTVTSVSMSIITTTATIKHNRKTTIVTTTVFSAITKKCGKGHHVTSSSSAAASSVTSSTTLPTPPVGSFDPLSSSNVAVYYGQGPLTSTTNLLELCTDPTVTIINLAFVSDFFGPGGYPKASFGPACNGPQTPLQQSLAPGLPNCAQLGEQISTCQTVHGKKILVSLGGYVASSSFPSDKEARKFARTLWNLFGAGTGEDSQLRPFGPGVVIDGFDIDNEDHDTTHWLEFARELKRLYESPNAVASGKSYYLSSTPQCPMPDASIPAEVMAMSDFVNIQFYNNPSCNLNSGQGFLSSFQAWSQSLAKSGSSVPKAFIAVPAWPGAGSGYLPGRSLAGVIAEARSAAIEHGNFGGIAMWDGLQGLQNVDSTGKNFIQYVAAALE